MGLFHAIKTLDPDKTGLHVVSDEELKQIHQILLEMLDDIKRVCDRNQIRWGIAGGCALGAVRHKGFIPWDDDVDIIFIREEYDKFRKVYPRECNRDYELICPGEDSYYMHLPRVFNTKTSAELIQNSGRGKGLYIDVFVLDNTYDNPVFRFFHGLQCTFYLFAISSVITRIQKDTLNYYGSDELRKKVRLRSFFGEIFSFREPEEWIKIGIQCFSKVRNNETKYVVSVTGSKHFFGETYERCKICTYQERKFENRQYPFMTDINYFCRKLYGDNYMQIPPEDKREKHVYISLNLNK